MAINSNRPVSFGFVQHLSGFGLFGMVCLWLLIFGLPGKLHAGCVKGYVVDVNTGLGVAFVHVSNPSKTAFAITDTSGYFNLCDERQDQTLIIHLSHTSYEPLVLTIPLHPQQAMVRIELIPREIVADEVVVHQSRKESKDQLMPGVQSIHQKDIYQLPVFMGEADVLKTIQLMPGIQTVSEGNSGLYVRGGGPGHNLFLLDKMELMNPSHLMGIYSVFNPLITSQVDVYKGNAPSQYEGRLASVISVETQQPVVQNNHVSGNVGNISANVAICQTSGNGKWGITAGFRRSYLEALAAMASLFMHGDKNYFRENIYNFYDFNGKIRFQANPNSFFYLNWYLGQDYFKIHNRDIGYRAKTRWGNSSVALVWDYTFTGGLNMKHILNLTQANSGFDGSIFDNKAKFGSTYRQLNWKNQFSKTFRQHQLQLGWDAYCYSTVPFDFEYHYLNDTVLQKEEFRNLSFSVHMGDTYRPGERFEWYAGVRITGYFGLGPYTGYSDVDTLHYGSGEVTHSYYCISPTVAFSWFPDKKSAFKAAYSLNTQYTHLASLSSIPLPNDFWVPSTPQIKPEFGHQIAFGYYNRWRDWEYSAECYLKLMQNQVLLNLNTDNSEDLHIEQMLYKGKGIAYGLNLSLNKNTNRFGYSVNYSLGHSQRSYAQIMEGEWFNDKYDRIHDLNALLTWKISQKWDVSALWVFATGNTTTLPAGRWWMMGMVMNDYNGYNNFRLPSYHRLDLSANLKLQSNLFKESVLSFSIINVYNRMNPYFLVYKVFMGESQYNLNIKVNQVSLFPIMPSVSWRFKF